MAAFPTLEITTMIGCPLMCTFCPQDNLRTEYGTDAKYMSLDTFKSALTNISPDTRIDFSGMAEPWVNPECTDMLAHAFERGHRVAIYTTLYNWDRATTDRVADLLVEYSDRLEVFMVHYPDRNGNMRGWKYNEDWEYALHVMNGVCNHIGVKFDGLTMSGDGLVHESLDHLGIRLWSWTGHDRAGTLPVEQVKAQAINIAPRHAVPIRCGKTSKYDQWVLLPNGDVVLCCMDYDLKHVLGNLTSQTVAEIRRGSAFQSILKENARSEFSNCSLCRTCTDAVPQ